MFVQLTFGVSMLVLLVTHANSICSRYNLRLCFLKHLACFATPDQRLRERSDSAGQMEETLARLISHQSPDSYMVKQSATSISPTLKMTSRTREVDSDYSPYRQLQTVSSTLQLDFTSPQFFSVVLDAISLIGMLLPPFYTVGLTLSLSCFSS